MHDFSNKIIYLLFWEQKNILFDLKIKKVKKLGISRSIRKWPLKKNLRTLKKFQIQWNRMRQNWWKTGFGKAKFTCGQLAALYVRSRGQRNTVVTRWTIQSSYWYPNQLNFLDTFFKKVQIFSNFQLLVFIIISLQWFMHPSSYFLFPFLFCQTAEEERGKRRRRTNLYE